MLFFCKGLCCNAGLFLTPLGLNSIKWRQVLQVHQRGLEWSIRGGMQQCGNVRLCFNGGWFKLRR
jgi:hypothetical protein